MDGQTASFLAGGEFPVPVVQSDGSKTSITIVFKEYGVRLNFKAHHRRRRSHSPGARAGSFHHRFRQWREIWWLPDPRIENAPRQDWC